MGLGGDTSWGRLVHEQYTLPVKDNTYSFHWIPFEKNKHILIFDFNDECS